MTAAAPFPSLCIFGASGDNPNLGVRALLESALVGIARRRPSADVTVFDDGWGIRRAVLDVDDHSFSYGRCGHRRSRRVYRSESHLNMQFSAALGGLRNPGVRLVDRADAVLDVSGGDSFTDLYGDDRFRAIAFPKEFALRRRRPLLLLPQTYGPFRDVRYRERARRIVVGAAGAWARDTDSFQRLDDLAGDEFDPARHKVGVDLAFGLPSRRPAEQPARFATWLAERDSVPVAGVNVNGLLYNSDESVTRFGLAGSYVSLVHELVMSLVAHGVRVLLVPHVGVGDSVDTDPSTCEVVRAHLELGPDRLDVLPPVFGASETKWIISQLDWFCGSRMHSTIAALSSGVPVVNVAYSDKAHGVFASVGQRGSVIDARRLGPSAAVERVMAHFANRDAHRAAIAVELPAVLAQADAQLDDLLAAVDAGRVRRGGEHSS